MRILRPPGLQRGSKDQGNVHPVLRRIRVDQLVWSLRVVVVAGETAVDVRAPRHDVKPNHRRGVKLFAALHASLH